MELIKKLEGSHSSTVELVKIGEKEYVLKTAEPEDVENEKEFLTTLRSHNLPALTIYEIEELKGNQILLEYIKNSPTLGNNVNINLVKKWGELMRGMHAIDFPTAATFSGGHLFEASWRDFVSDQIRLAEKKTSFQIKKILEPLLNYAPEKYSLLHGDCHSNNVLVKDDVLYLFDKSSEIFYGDPFYDLALIALEFPNGLYIKSADPLHRHDREYLHAFIEGYGYDFTQEFTKLESYVLLRAVIRHPNPFESYLGEIIEKIVNLLNSETRL